MQDQSQKSDCGEGVINKLPISSLTVARFRCLQDFKLRELSQFTLFTGKNESGKTSALQAIAAYGRQAVPAGSIVTVPPSWIKNPFLGETFKFVRMGGCLGKISPPGIASFQSVRSFVRQYCCHPSTQHR